MRWKRNSLNWFDHITVTRREGASRVAHFFNPHVPPPVPPLRELSIVHRGSRVWIDNTHRWTMARQIWRHPINGCLRGCPKMLQQEISEHFFFELDARFWKNVKSVRIEKKNLRYTITTPSKQSSPAIQGLYLLVEVFFSFLYRFQWSVTHSHAEVRPMIGVVVVWEEQHCLPPIHLPADLTGASVGGEGRGVRLSMP